MFWLFSKTDGTGEIGLVTPSKFCLVTPLTTADPISLPAGSVHASCEHGRIGLLVQFCSGKSCAKRIVPQLHEPPISEAITCMVRRDKVIRWLSLDWKWSISHNVSPRAGVFRVRTRLCNQDPDAKTVPRSHKYVFQRLRWLNCKRSARNSSGWWTFHIGR